MVDDRVRALRARFRTLHESGCFVLPNPWDVGSAQVLVQLGFPALASTSAGFAWSIGHRDNAVTLDDVLVHLRTLVAAVPVPVNADFEGGFAVDPEGVAANVARAPATVSRLAASRLKNHTPDRPPARTYVRTFSSGNVCAVGSGGSQRQRVRAMRNGTTPSHARPSNVSTSTPAGRCRCSRAASIGQCRNSSSRQSIVSTHGVSASGHGRWVVSASAGGTIRTA